MRILKEQLASLLQLRYYIFALLAIIVLRLIYNSVSADGLSMEDISILLTAFIGVSITWFVLRIPIRPKQRVKEPLPKLVQSAPAVVLVAQDPIPAEPSQ
jgi:hypothetical protein